MVPEPHIDHSVELLPGKLALLTARRTTEFGRMAVIRVASTERAWVGKFDCSLSSVHKNEHGFVVSVIGIAHQFNFEEAFRASSKSAFIGYSTTTRWIVMMSIDYEHELWFVPTSGTKDTEWGMLVEIV